MWWVCFRVMIDKAFIAWLGGGMMQKSIIWVGSNQGVRELRSLHGSDTMRYNRGWYLFIEIP